MTSSMTPDQIANERHDLAMLYARASEELEEILAVKPAKALRYEK
jgi:hypothetical protein